MVESTPVSVKEVLAWLVRVSQLANKALENLNKGNPYDAIRLIKVISNVDIGLLNVLAHVPNYDLHVKPYHVELINECKAILVLSNEALQMFSPELQNWPAEKLAKYATLFQSLLGELDKELNAEKEVAHWLSEAEKAFLSREKAWTYSRNGLENALRVLNSLVQNEKAMGQTAERFSKIAQGVKHSNLKQFIEDLLKKRLRVRAVVELILKGAFKSIFTFGGHDWYSELAKVSGLPSENIKELETMREQLVTSTIFVKRNVNYGKIRQLLTRLIALSQHARKVERAIEIAEETANEVGKSDEEILKRHWEAKVSHCFVYHGTSSIFLPNIERFGLSSEQIFSEGTPFKPEDYAFFLEVSRKAYGADAPHLKYFTQDVIQGFFLDSNYNFAVNYARQGPERIRFMLEHIRDIEKEFRQGLFSGRVSQQEVNRLMEILRRYESAMSHHRPIVLHIPMNSPALLAVLNQNGLGNVAELIANYQTYRQLALNYLNAARTGGNNPNFAVPTTKLAEILEKFDPLVGYFHNRPLKGTIPWTAIAKAEYV